MRFIHGVAAAALVCCGGAWVTNAGAQERTAYGQTAQPLTQETEAYDGPDRGLLLSGFLTFGIPYFASVGVAAGSQHVGDNHLYVPFAGPWMDLNQRAACNDSTAACDNETTNKILLVGNGLLQGLGGLQIIGAFLFPEHQVGTIAVPATALTPKMTISPARVGPNAYGLSAVGRF